MKKPYLLIVKDAKGELVDAARVEHSWDLDRIIDTLRAGDTVTVATPREKEPEPEAETPTA